MASGREAEAFEATRDDGHLAPTLIISGSSSGEASPGGNLVADPNDPFPAGLQLSSVRIIERLGAGNMGVVYLGHDDSLDRPVVVKTLQVRTGGDVNRVEALARFQEEARAVARLSHTNVAQIFEVGRARGTHYFVMEYVDGGSLADLLKESQPALTQVVDILRGIALGLQAAHSQGIIHRDIKPDNLMLTRSGEVKVVDFGLAKRPESAGLTSESSVLGTPYFMAPEQCGGGLLDGRADLYALGVTAYKVLTGEYPFDGKHPIEVITAKLQRDAPSIRARRPDLPPPLAALIDALLARDPSDRPADAAEVARRLADPGLLGPGPPPSRRKLALVLGGLALLALGVAALTAGLKQRAASQARREKVAAWRASEAGWDEREPRIRELIESISAIDFDPQARRAAGLRGRERRRNTPQAQLRDDLHELSRLTLCPPSFDAARWSKLALAPAATWDLRAALPADGPLSELTKDWVRDERGLSFAPSGSPSAVFFRRPEEVVQPLPAPAEEPGAYLRVQLRFEPEAQPNEQFLALALPSAFLFVTPSNHLCHLKGETEDANAKKRLALALRRAGADAAFGDGVEVIAVRRPEGAWELILLGDAQSARLVTPSAPQSGGVTALCGAGARIVEVAVGRRGDPRSGG